VSNPKFASPEQAVETLIQAYQSMDVEAIVAAKDFTSDSRLFWEGLGLPISDKQRTESVVAFEKNFRDQISTNGIPDYRDVKYTFKQRQQLHDNFVVLTLDCLWPDGSTVEMKLPALKVGSEWKAVLAPGYDHL